MHRTRVWVWILATLEPSPAPTYMGIPTGAHEALRRSVRFGYPFSGTRERKLDCGFRVHGNPESGHVPTFRNSALEDLRREIQASWPFLGTQEPGSLWVPGS